MDAGITNKEVIRRYSGLLRACRNKVTPDDVKLISKAYREIVHLYDGQEYRPGLPYAFHAIDVARICVDEIGLGGTSIVAALLHDTISDSLLTLEDIEKGYTKPIALIVDGLSKIALLDPKNPQAQAEGFKELILSLSSDARVILIKLAERLETMRSLHLMPESHRLKISWETFHLYAPLGHRLGLYQLKSEMEDLAMRYTAGDEYKHITQKLKSTTNKRNKLIKEFILPVEQKLAATGLSYSIKGRPKAVYSIWKKMQKQGVTFEEVYDVFAIRIILDSPPDKEKADCWQVYSLVTDIWNPNPDRLRDWISVPKSNGYESLHTTVVGPEGKWVEVQIRSKRMDDIAERGLAAHWKYKGIKQEHSLDRWVDQVREILETPSSSPEEMVNEFKLSLYQKEVFVFTPKGDIKKFPKGAIILDFAFDIHSNVGSSCTGAKVNNRIVPIKYQLQNGDTIEILTSKSQKPKAEWLQMVVTGKAKTKIRQCIREDKNKQLTIGKEMLYRRLKNWKVENTEQAVLDLTKHLKLKSPAMLFDHISNQKIELTDYKAFLLGQTEKAEDTIVKKEPLPSKTKEEYKKETTDYLVIDERLVNIDYKLAKCCNPILGDSIFGFVTINDGIKIHRTNCPNAAQLHEKYGYRVINAQWKQDVFEGSFQTTIRVTGIDELGMVSKITELISKDLKVNMRSFSMSSANGLFEGKIQVFVADKKHLEMLIYRMSKLKGVHKVTRMNRE